MPGLASDRELATALNKSPTALSKRRSANSTPYKEIILALWNEDLDYILRGLSVEGPALTVRMDLQVPEEVEVDGKYR